MRKKTPRNHKKQLSNYWKNTTKDTNRINTKGIMISILTSLIILLCLTFTSQVQSLEIENTFYACNTPKEGATILTVEDGCREIRQEPTS